MLFDSPVYFLFLIPYFFLAKVLGADMGPARRKQLLILPLKRIFRHRSGEQLLAGDDAATASNLLLAHYSG